MALALTGNDGLSPVGWDGEQGRCVGVPAPDSRPRSARACSSEGMRRTKSLNFEAFGDVADTPPLVHWSWQGILQTGRVYTLTGKPGAGKTTIAQRIAVEFARGGSLAGRRFLKSRALFLAGENPDDVLIRASISKLHHGLEDRLPLDFVQGAFALADKFQDLARQAEHIGGYGLVVVDSLAAFAAAAGIGEEDANLDMHHVASQLRALTQIEGRPTVLVISHPTKSATRDTMLPRGASATLAAMDGNIGLWSNGDGLVDMYIAGKWRGPYWQPMSWQLWRAERSDVVFDVASGTPIPTSLAGPMDACAAESKQARLSQDCMAVLQAVEAGTDRQNKLIESLDIGERRTREAVKVLLEGKLLSRAFRNASLALTRKGRQHLSSFTGRAD